MALEVWWSSLTAADRGLLAVLSSSERARAASLEQPADRGRSMLGAALLRVAVATHLGIGPAKVVVDRTCAECGGPHGAPRVVGPATSPPWVSVSHSGLLVAVALGTEGPVGVDVQRESDLLDPSAGEDWVRGEAAFKARAAGAACGGSGASPPPTAVEGTTVLLRPPLDGYAAALTAWGPNVRTGYVTRSWPAHMPQRCC